MYSTYYAHIVTFTDNELIIQGKNKKHYGRIEIPYDTITGITYEKSKHWRVASAILLTPLTLFSRRKHHWFSIAYVSADSTSETVFLRLDKKEESMFRQVAPQKTGKKLEIIIED